MGFTEILFISGLALILIGPKQLPEVARTLGRIIADIRRNANMFTEELKKPHHPELPPHPPMKDEDENKS